MKHLITKGNTFYAVLTVPSEVRHVIGRVRFFQSTKTGNEKDALVRASILIHGWKSEISKARGRLPDLKDNFWVNLRNDHINAPDEGTRSVIQDIAEAAVLKLEDQEQASQLYKFSTNQSGPVLAPLVADWKSAQRGGQKTIDQKYRDLEKLAAHFFCLEALQPQKIKVWTDKLMLEGATYSSFVRIGGACHSFWAYLQNANIVPMVAPDPFVGSFKLALKQAVRTDTGRSGSAYTAEQMTMIYVEALKLKDKALADLIALGAYSGARVEELGRLTKETCKDGIFNITISKTVAGIRQVPIHPAVAPLVARLLEASTDGYLLPSTSDNQYGLRMPALGQKFTRLKTSLGFGTGHVFHSTRSTLITLMQQAGVPEGIAADVVGHGKKTMTYGLYSAGSSIAQKFGEAISKVSYPGALGKP